MAPLDYDTRLEHLLSTAARVFARKGFHPTSMRDLSRETGMSLAGMYHYVSSKDELLYLVQRRCFTMVLEGAEAAIAGAGEPDTRLERFVRHHVIFFADHMNEMKVLSHEAESVSLERKAGIDALKRRYSDILTGLLADVQQKNGVDPTVSAYAVFGMMNWIYTWYDPDGKIRPGDLADHLTHIVLNGVTNQALASRSNGGSTDNGNDSETQA